VLIGAEGLVLTIGYLVLEAEDVALVRDDGSLVPARVLAYDVATGFGLLQALTPLGLDPVPLGRSAAIAPQEPLMIASGGGDGAVSVAQLVSRRAFAGYWEYHIEGALFTSPPRRDHSGAGLFNGAGELVGVGSLLVADAVGSADGLMDGTGAGQGGGDTERPRRSGNLFVPVDLLTPILAELRSRGFSAASRRAWLGMNCAVQDGRVRVVRVSDDSPADVAGLEAGDHILRIDGTEVRALDQLWKTLWAGGAPEREIRLEIERDNAVQTLTVFSVDRMKTLKRAEGI
jgi:S1-C subfamily serine protease